MSGLLHLHRMGRRFGGLAAVDDVSIELAAGARHALIGPNGAGKTTLLHLIAGTLRPTSGAITFDGVDVTRRSAPARARRGIGRTWQHPAVFDRLTVTANLALAVDRHTVTGSRGTPAGLVRRAGWAGRAGRAGRSECVPRVERVQRALTEAGLAPHAATVAGRLPYGMRRRLELAMALAARPRLLLLDEPSAGLDGADIAWLSRLLAAQPAEVTVLLVDHNLELVWSLADTVTVLHHGRHLATGDPGTIRSDPQVHEAYLSAGELGTRHRNTATRPEPIPAPPAPHASTAPAAAPPLLRVRQLRAGYHGAPVLHGVDLDVAEGEVVAVLGRNGAGKTTLLNAVAGLLPPLPGSRVELAGQELLGRRPHLVARAGVALVPQGRRLFAPLTVAEHLTCAVAVSRGRNRDPDRTRTRTRNRNRDPDRGRDDRAPTWTVERVLELLPQLATRLNHPGRALSGGEQQLLALARALLTQPRLLLLDEPSEGLAPQVVQRLAAVLIELAAGGQAVLVAEQNLALATAISDRVVVLGQGRTVLTAPTDEFAARGETDIQTMLSVAGPGLR